MSQPAHAVIVSCRRAASPYDLDVVAADAETKIEQGVLAGVEARLLNASLNGFEYAAFQMLGYFFHPFIEIEQLLFTSSLDFSAQILNLDHNANRRRQKVGGVHADDTAAPHRCISVVQDHLAILDQRTLNKKMAVPAPQVPGTVHLRGWRTFVG